MPTHESTMSRRKTPIIDSRARRNKITQFQLDKLLIYPLSPQQTPTRAPRTHFYKMSVPISDDDESVKYLKNACAIISIRCSGLTSPRGTRTRTRTHARTHGMYRNGIIIIKKLDQRRRDPPRKVRDSLSNRAAPPPLSRRRRRRLRSTSWRA